MISSLLSSLWRSVQNINRNESTHTTDSHIREKPVNRSAKCCSCLGLLSLPLSLLSSALITTSHIEIEVSFRSCIVKSSKKEVSIILYGSCYFEFPSCIQFAVTLILAFTYLCN